MPDNAQNATDLRLQIAEHQANLMRLGEAWGQHIVDALDEADRQTIAKLQSLLEKLKFERNTAAGMKQLDRIRKEIEKIRVKAYAQAEKKLREEAKALAKNESKWARRILFAFAGLSFVKALMQPKQQEQQKWLEQYAKENPLPPDESTDGEETTEQESAKSTARPGKSKPQQGESHRSATQKHRHKQLKVKRLAKPTQAQVTQAANVKSSDVTPGLTDAETERVVKRGVLQNKRWDEWWTHTADVDVQRVAEAVNEGINNGLTVEETTAIIRGTKEGNFEDGILSKNRQDARRMARTILAGIANEAKEQFYQDNADVLLGVEWLDTLDGRTCFGCASLSRQQWKLDEPHPVPPLHPNCRCVLIPVTPLSALVDEARPAAKSDFMADARRAYEAKYPDKKFDDLAESTRKKYYYEAIKEYEQRTGQPAFEMVRGGVNFKEYFENVMTEQQRRDWLGPQRYELWRTGRYKFEDFVSPYPNRNVTVAELKKADQQSLFLGINIFKKNKTPSFDAKNIDEITAQTKLILGIDDVDFKGITDENLLNRMNKALYDLKKRYPFTITSVKSVDYLGNREPAATDILNGLALNGKYLNILLEKAPTIPSFNGKYFVNDGAAMYVGKEIESIIYHEIAHAILNDQTGSTSFSRRKENPLAKEQRHKRAIIKQIWRRATKNGDAARISKYAQTNESEFFSEVFTADFLDNKPLPDYIKNGIMEVLK